MVEAHRNAPDLKSPPTPGTKIGSTLFVFDVNRRTYKRDGNGPDYASHFAPYKVTGETKQSWLVGPRDRKVNKVTLKEARRDFTPLSWFTAETMEQDIWAHEHRYNIECRVRAATVPQLKKVAELLGYKA